MTVVERFEDPEALRVAAEAFCAREYRRAAACRDPASLAVFRHERLAMLAPVFTVLGTVADGERLSHVIVRYAHGSPLGRDGLAFDSQASTSIETNTARRRLDGSWLLVGGERFLGTDGSMIVACGVDDDAAEPTDAGP